MKGDEDLPRHTGRVCTDVQMEPERLGEPAQLQRGAAREHRVEPASREDAQRAFFFVEASDRADIPHVFACPQHAAFMTMLAPGELILKKGTEEIPFVVTGGFFEVLNDKVIVLADAAERADEIDTARAEAARDSARLAIERRESTEDLAMAAASLQRAMIRLRISENRRRRAGQVRR